MNFKKNKRLISLAIVAVVIIFSLVRGTLSTSKSSEIPTGYLEQLLESQTVNTLTLQPGDSSEVIQKISIEGEIGSEMTNAYSRSSVLNQIKAAKNNPNVKAILLSVNTPGGGVYETAELYHALLDSGKDIYVSMKKQATSGGYYVSMAAKKIYANTETTTGSIGVIMSYISAQKFLNDNGIKQETIRSGEQKAVGGIAEDLPESTRKIYEQQNKESFDRFVKAIAKGRNMSEDKVRELADGRTYSGEQALSNNLIDKIGSEEDLLNFIKEDKNLNSPTVIEIRQNTTTENLLSRFVKATTKSIISELNSEATTNQVEKSYLG